jgi:hypothetical protein
VAFDCAALIVIGVHDRGVDDHDVVFLTLG